MPKITHLLILDNGAHSIKAGFSHDSTPKIIPNCVTKVKSERRRPFIGDQLEECKDYSGLFYILPFTKGFLINWDVQRQVWDYLFRTKLKLPTDSKNRFSEVAILITEPVYNFRPIRMNMIELLFEDYGFGEILICSAPQLAAFQYCFQENKSGHSDRDTVIDNNNTRRADKASREIACLVVDSGFSFTHVVPFVEGHKVLAHTKRINVGGKVLTNHLKDIISYRQLNVLDETYVVNQMKEDCCFVSTQFWRDLETAALRGAQNTIVRDYVLPDYIACKRGYVFDKENEEHRNRFNPNEHQRIRMNNERFQVPELLFNPGDVNIDQIGISHSIVHAVSEFTPNFDSDWPAEPPAADGSSPASSSFPRDRLSAKPESNLMEIDSDEDESELEEEDGEEVERTKAKTRTKKPETNGDKSRSSTKASVANGKQTSSSEEDQESDKEAKAIDLSMYQDENVQSHLYNNILLIGGNSAFPNFAQRVYTDIRSNAADLLNIRVMLPEDPATFAWKGGRTLCRVNEQGDDVSNRGRSLFHQYSVTRKEYDEHGLAYCAKKLANFQLPTFSTTKP